MNLNKFEQLKEDLQKLLMIDFIIISFFVFTLSIMLLTQSILLVSALTMFIIFLTGWRLTLTKQLIENE